jgi:DNA modification methylase
MGVRKKKYIAHLAEFSFQPDESLSRETAEQLYQTRQNQYNEQITYGDCIAGMGKMDAESVDLVVADPPFGIDFSGKESIYNRNKDLVVGNYQEIGDEYEEFSEAWIGQLPRIMKKTASAYIISGYTNLEFVLPGIRKAGLKVINHLV